MKKLITTTALITAAGFAPFLVPSAFAQASITAPTQIKNYNQATISWQTQPNTACYRIYYKETSAPKWQFAIHCKDLPKASFQYIIKDLKPATGYTYDVRAVSNVNRKETSLGIKQMVTTPMVQ